MKINGSNRINFNPYKQHIQKQADMKNSINKSDQLQISKEALKLQEQVKPNEKRTATVQEIKQQVANGEYQVDIEKTAKKMLDFWKR